MNKPAFRHTGISECRNDAYYPHVKGKEPYDLCSLTLNFKL